MTGQGHLVKIALQSAATAVLGLLFFGVTLLVPADTLHYWQAWMYIAVFIVGTMGPSLYLAVKQPAVLQRRLNAGPLAETRPAQRFAMWATLLTVIGVLVISALDHRFGWSSVPTPVVILGVVLVAVGLGMTQLVILQNGYAAATVTVEAGQQLTTSGLYGRGAPDVSRRSGDDDRHPAGIGFVVGPGRVGTRRARVAHPHPRRRAVVA